MRRRQGNLPGPGLQGTGTGGGMCGGPGALPGGREPAGRRVRAAAVFWHPHQRGREGSGGCPTSKGGPVTGRAAGHWE